MRNLQDGNENLSGAWKGKKEIILGYEKLIRIVIIKSLNPREFHGLIIQIYLCVCVCVYFSGDFMGRDFLAQLEELLSQIYFEAIKIFS